MIESVQKIGANLQAVLFGNRDELLHPDIPVPGAGAINRIPLGVAPLPWLRWRKGAGIEPLHALDHIMRARLPRIN